MDEKVLEMAEATALAIVDNSVAKVRAKVKKREPSFDGNCVECGEPVPSVRVDFGADTCIDCQEYLEQRERFAR